MRRPSWVLLIALGASGCAHRAPEGAELWVPREQSVPAAGQLEGHEVWVPADASRARGDASSN
jgi:hypothetical protein